jgi:hypothetical protein
MDVNGNVIDSVSVSSTDVANDGSLTITLPTQLPAGFAYTIDTETDTEIMTCSPANDGTTETSGVISGPVTLSPNCFQNNC